MNVVTTLWCSTLGSMQGIAEPWYTYLAADEVARTAHGGFWIPLCNGSADPTPSGGYLNPRYIVRAEALLSD